MTLHVTNRRVIVTGDVNLDIQMFYVAKDADLDTMEMGAGTFATDIV